MATATAVASGATESSNISLSAGTTYQFYSSRPLTQNEVVELQRSYDSGTTYVSVGILLGPLHKQAAVTGPGEFKVVKKGSFDATIYQDS